MTIQSDRLQSDTQQHNSSPYFNQHTMNGDSNNHINYERAAAEPKEETQ